MADPQGVSIAFDATTLAASPTWTRLDSVNQFVSSWSIQRGRSYELDQMQSGTATVEIRDRTGRLDPTNPSSPYYGKIEPLKQAAIALRNPVTGNWRTRFRGFIEDWTYEPDPSNAVMVLTLQLADAMIILNAVEMAPGTAGMVPVPKGSEGQIVYAGQPVDDRINAALDDAGWPTGPEFRDIFTGNVNVLPTVYSPGETIMAVVDDACQAEFPGGIANYYISADGVFTFHGRLARFNDTDSSYGIAHWKAGDGAAVAADPTHFAHIRQLSWNRGLARIINAGYSYPMGADQTEAGRIALADQVVLSTASIASYGVRSWSAENLVCAGHVSPGTTTGLEECYRFAQYYVDNYSSPRNRINRAVFRSMHPADPRATYNWNLICNVELNDVIAITVDNPGTSGGGFSLEPYFVEGISYDVAPASSDYHDVTLTLDLSPKAWFTSFPS